MREVGYPFPVLLVLWAVLGYFVYGGMDGALAMILLSIVLGLAVPVALIPFVGFIVYAFLAYYVILPWVIDLTKIDPTWLTSLIVLVDVVMAGLITFATSIVVLALTGVVESDLPEKFVSNLGLTEKPRSFKFFRKLP